MARIELEMPTEYSFSTEMLVRISDINYAGHLGNEAILSIMHEARIRYLKAQGYSEADVEGSSMIMTDTAIVYKAESFHADQLRVDVAVTDFNKYGCDFFYLISHAQSLQEIARGKTGIVFFDYAASQIQQVPQAFKRKVLNPG